MIILVKLLMPPLHSLLCRSLTPYFNFKLNSFLSAEEITKIFFNWTEEKYFYSYSHREMNSKIHFKGSHRLRWWVGIDIRVQSKWGSLDLWGGWILPDISEEPVESCTFEKEKTISSQMERWRFYVIYSFVPYRYSVVLIQNLRPYFYNYTGWTGMPIYWLLIPLLACAQYSWCF